MLAALLGDDASLAPLTQLLMARTEGIPFFLKRACGPWLRPAPGRRTRGLSLAQALPTIQVPATVQAVLAARIDRLPPEEKTLLQTAASLAPKCLCPCSRPLPNCLKRRCTVAWTTCRPPSFSRNELFPEQVCTFKHALTHEVPMAACSRAAPRTPSRVVEILEKMAGDRVAEQVERLRTMPCGGRCGTRP